MLTGACVRIKAFLGHSLLWLACRHHIHKVVLKHAFEQCCGSSSGPEILIFKGFQEQWGFTDWTSYHTLLDQEKPLDDFSESQWLVMVDFLGKVLGDGSHPCKDYGELLRLCLLFHGGNISSLREFCFRSPGAYHQARWMIEAIYAIKIVLFENQLKLTHHMARGLQKVALFIN